MFSAHLPTQVGFFPALARRLALFDRVVVPFWVRRQDSYIASLTVQRAKGGASGRFAGDAIPDIRDANYYRVLSRLEQHVKGIEFRPHLYREGSHVLKEFLDALSLDSSMLGEQKPMSVNTSVSAEMYLLQCQINRAAKRRGIHARPLQLALLRAWEGMPAATTQPGAIPLTHEDRLAIIARYRESNRRLCRRFGFDMLFFEPPREVVLKAPAYNIPSAVTPEFLHEMRARMNAIAKTVRSEHVRLLVEMLQHAGSEPVPAG
jgi:hypothetical protein